MTSVMQRQRSRRKLAALTFLSNISLDGTHRDTRLSCYANRDGKKNPTINEKENENSEDLTNEKPSGNITTCGSIKEKTVVNRSVIVQSQQILGLKRQRCSTTSISVCEVNATGPLKKRPQQVSLSEKNPYFSSNESIVQTVMSGSIQGIGVSGASESPVPPNKEVRFTKTFVPSGGDERVVLLSSNKTPFHIFSTIPFNKSKFTRVEQLRGEPTKKRHVSGARPLSTISDTADSSHIFNMERYDVAIEYSYCQLLSPSENQIKKPRRQHSEHGDAVDGPDRPLHPGVARCFSYEPATHKATAHYVPHSSEKGVTIYEKDDWRNTPANKPLQVYFPHMLDDSELRAGKHRKLLRFSSYMTSVIDYTKPSELKKELNDKFREKYPQIQLTLSKLRSLKREMLKIARQDCNIDLLTVAQAYVYFERLILKTIVNKPNRKLIAGACLILSAKLNDVKREILTNLIEKTESTFRLNRKELIHWEFATLVALEFSLHLPYWEINSHYQRLLYES